METAPSVAGPSSEPVFPSPEEGGTHTGTIRLTMTSDRVPPHKPIILSTTLGAFLAACEEVRIEAPWWTMASLSNMADQTERVF
jgi:hypothetical protein